MTRATSLSPVAGLLAAGCAADWRGPRVVLVSGMAWSVLAAWFSVAKEGINRDDT
jgi:hypothetical protein